MRYPTDHKQATRRRIVEAAGRRFKRDGIDGSGIATLMKDAGLTNGAFYAHFASKDDLISSVVADQMRAQGASLSSVSPGRVGVEEFVRWYLSVEHRDNPEGGCPSAALLDEIGRCTKPTKDAYTEGALAVVDEIAARLERGDPQTMRSRVISAFALMIGLLQLSRAMADETLADQILEQGVNDALELMCGEPWS